MSTLPDALLYSCQKTVVNLANEANHLLVPLRYGNEDTTRERASIIGHMRDSNQDKNDEKRCEECGKEISLCKTLEDVVSVVKYVLNH